MIINLNLPTKYFIICGKANRLNSRQYMQYLLEELPQLATTKNPELLEAYLPWHPNIQAKFKKNDKIPY